MAAIDENAAALGVPRSKLMESSGNAIARAVRDLAAPDDRVVCCAGRGNNGGDAFAAARFLSAYDVEVWLLGRPGSIRTEIARENWAALEHAEIPRRVIRDSREIEPPEADVVVDALLGTGISGDPREPAASMIRAIEDADATVVSVDVPSGLDGETGTPGEPTVTPDRVVTFHDEKPGLPELAARVTVADIGIPSAAETVIGPGDRRLVRRETREARVMVVGGGPYAGAPALAARAALRAGAELAFVAAPDAIADEIQTGAPDLIVQPFAGEHLQPAHVPELVETAHRYDDVVVLGPGLGTHEETLDAVGRFLESFEGPTVVDADALAVVPEVDPAGTLVCTPNPRELALLGGPDGLDDPGEYPEAVATVATDLGQVVLAKGPVDVVSDGDRTRRNRTGSPGMAVGGSGDVLAGVVATLLDGAEPMDAAGVGAYVNGLAGERLAESDGTGFLASDLADAIPRSLWKERPLDQ